MARQQDKQGPEDKRETDEWERGKNGPTPQAREDKDETDEWERDKSH